MTPNQTIDGVLVSRELLERFVSDVEAHNYGFEGLDEVRALLDEPSECRCKRYGKGNPHWPCPVHPVKPAAQPQGEPVAEIASKYGDPEAFGERELITLKDISKFPYGTKLYADQPAPVAVVRLGTHHVLGAIHNVEGFPGVTGYQIKTLTDLLNSAITGK